MDSIYRATPSHLHQVRQVLHRARQRFINFGDEDLASLLRDGVTVIGASAAQPWGVMILQREQRAAAPLAAATPRAFLRGVALTSGRSPVVDVPHLTAIMAAQLPPLTPLQTVVYCDGWLVTPLKAAGFELVDRLQYLELSGLQARAAIPPNAWAASDVNLRLAGPDDLLAVAQLDAEAFSSIWRLGRQDMMTLLLTGRVQLAMRDEQFVGYTALSMHMNPPARPGVQLARLAVHPAAQGAGIGRMLLVDAIDYARGQAADSLTLNTQASNERSLALYRAFGFHNIGKITPVLARTFSADVQDDI